MHVCPDLLGSLADETRGETEQVADGEPSDGAGCSSCRQPCPQGGVWPAGNFMPIDRPGLGMCARYDGLIDGWAHEGVGKRRGVISKNISFRLLRSAAESRSV